MQPWKEHKIPFWEKAPFVKLLLPQIAGILLYDAGMLPQWPKWVLLTILFCILAGCMLSAATLKKPYLQEFLETTFVCLALFMASWICCRSVETSSSTIIHTQEQTSKQSFWIKILEDPVERKRTWRMRVALIGRKADTLFQKTEGTALLYIYKTDQPITLKAGDEVLVPDQWMPITNWGNPHEFDYEKYSRRNHIVGQQFCHIKNVQRIQTSEPQQSVVQKIHHFGIQALRKFIPDPATLGLLEAMLLGEDQHFDEDIRQAYADTGIIHIVAISGSHVMIFFYLASGLFFWIRHHRFQYLKYLISVPLVCLYVAVAGAPASAVRAAIMFSFLALSLSLQQNRLPLNQLFGTAFFMLLYEPYWLFSVGFQLSFIAVLSLILFYKPIYRMVPSRYWCIRVIWGVVASSLAAEILIAPLVVYYFHLFPLSFILANVVAYMFMSVVLTGGLLLIVLSEIPLVATAIGKTLVFIVQNFHEVIRWFQQLNPESLRHLFLSGAALMILYVIISGLAAFFLNKQKAGLFISLIGIVFFLGISLSRQWEILGQQKLFIYNDPTGISMEIISGNGHFSTFSQTTENHRNLENRIALGAWRKKGEISEPIFQWKNKTILILSEPWELRYSGVFPVDYLVIHYPVKQVAAKKLYETFQFKRLILAGKQSGFWLNKWKENSQQLQIPVHFTSFDGAFSLRAKET